MKTFTQLVIVLFLGAAILPAPSSAQSGTPFGERLARLAHNSFRNMELAYGREFGDYRYYDESFSLGANMIRLSSTPGFQATWEARGHLNMSLYHARKNNSSPDKVDGTRALTFNGDLALMFNPALSAPSAPVTVRFLSDLGVEFGTFSPAFRDLSEPNTSNNVGKTTAIAPQLGAGLSLAAGRFTVYSMGTWGGGTTVINSPDYRYRSAAFQLGMRYNDTVHLLYALSNSNWADGENKNARVNRVTLGLLLNSLFRKNPGKAAMVPGAAN